VSGAHARPFHRARAQALVRRGILQEKLWARAANTRAWELKMCSKERLARAPQRVCKCSSRADRACVQACSQRVGEIDLIHIARADVRQARTDAFFIRALRIRSGVLKCRRTHALRACLRCRIGRNHPKCKSQGPTLCAAMRMCPSPQNRWFKHFPQFKAQLKDPSAHAPASRNSLASMSQRLRQTRLGCEVAPCCKVTVCRELHDVCGLGDECGPEPRMCRTKRDKRATFGPLRSVANRRKGRRLTARLDRVVYHYPNPLLLVMQKPYEKS
jgi:hypothetical protein